MVKRLLIGVLVLLTGCSSSFYGRGKKLTEQGEYDRAIENFYNEIAANPQSSLAWRELGVAFYKKGDPDKSYDALKQAAAIKPDARTHLFLGLVHEKRLEYEKAIEAYAASLNLRPGRGTKSAVSAHLDRLLAKKIEVEVAMALAHESELDVTSIPGNTIAVVNFDASHLSPELAPMAVGLAELTASDLAKVKSLNVVERLKIDAIMKELELSGSGSVDQATAPRMGLLLGSHKVVTGSLLGIGEEGLRLDGVIVNTVDSSTISTDVAQGELQQIFDIEKKFVLDIVGELGITLTPEERNAIREVPTESYLAFLSYSRGLSFRQQGMNEVARQEFENAVTHDGNFQAARGQLSSVAAVGVAYESSLESLESFATIGGEGVGGGDLDSRLAAVAQNGGILPNMKGSSTALNQPQIGRTGRVTIILDFDND